MILLFAHEYLVGYTGKVESKTWYMSQYTYVYVYSIWYKRVSFVEYPVPDFGRVFGPPG